MGIRRSRRSYPFKPQTSVFSLADEDIFERDVSRKKKKQTLTKKKGEEGRKKKKKKWISHTSLVAAEVD